MPHGTVVWLPPLQCVGFEAVSHATYSAEMGFMSAISITQAAVLGVVEGVTEFLPVSSTGHLKITEGLMNIPVDDKAVVAFTAVIQVGAIAAVLLYFFKDIVRIVSAWVRGITNREERYHHDYKFAWWVIYATIPIVIVGLAAKPLIDGPLASLWVVGASLIVGSGFMWAADQMGRHKRGEDDVTLKDSMIVGCSQILALLFPGFSRSGATMSTALIRDLDRLAATRLSFFLGIPALTGAGLYELKDAVGAGVDTTPLIVGTAVSFVVAYASIAWLLKFIAKHSFNAFVIYRIIIGLALFGLLGTNVLTA
jgi:undecaprenyl-diphosphatase